MEDSNSLADSMILDYLRKNCRYAVVKAFAKEKNIDLEKAIRIPFVCHS